MIKELEHPLPLITGAHPFQKKLYESITKEKTSVNPCQKKLCESITKKKIELPCQTVAIIN
jgi:hypothetical protein